MHPAPDDRDELDVAHRAPGRDLGPAHARAGAAGHGDPTPVAGAVTSPVGELGSARIAP